MQHAPIDTGLRALTLGILAVVLSGCSAPPGPASGERFYSDGFAVDIIDADALVSEMAKHGVQAKIYETYNEYSRSCFDETDCLHFYTLNVPEYRSPNFTLATTSTAPSDTYKVTALILESSCQSGEDIPYIRGSKWFIWPNATGGLWQLAKDLGATQAWLSCDDYGQ